MAKGLISSRETLALPRGPFVSTFYVAVTSREEGGQGTGCLRVLTPVIADKEKAKKILKIQIAPKILLLEVNTTSVCMQYILFPKERDGFCL